MGYRVDKNANLFPEGLFLLEIVQSETKRSKSSGDGMFKVKLRDTKTNRTFYENWMMEGNGVKRTIQKLDAIGLDLDDEIEADDLLDKRLIARVKHKDSPGYDTQAQIDKCWPESRPPQEWKDANPEEGSPDLFDDEGPKAPARPPVDDDTPF